MRLCTRSADDTSALGARLGELLRAGDVVVLTGDLGTGKTVLAQGIGRGLGVREPIVSPTFTIVREYDGRLPLLHLDVYRLDHVQEAIDLGLDELLDEGRVAVVEWGEVVGALLPADRLEVELALLPPEEAGDDVRVVELRPLGPSWVARRDDLAAAAGG
jgi:tRNA threonylcarbamoyladenosine biosynthesis protein TsaE